MAKRQKNRQQHNGQKSEEEKDKQRSIKHKHQTKDRVKRTPLKCLYWWNVSYVSQGFNVEVTIKPPTLYQ